ncbi:uncharacterized protein [Haliotis cracherodii]|uniref:uncharacterized protein n=1 Tax=Haliotis cracherodii TaxID=6455 RepID=UPI0039ED5018
MHLNVIVPFLLIWIHASHGTSELTCPSQSEVGSTADIMCVAPDATDKHGYSTPTKEVAALCQTKLSTCQPLGDYSAAVINETCSVLTIPSVKLSDAGDWRCTVSPSPMLTCHMVVYKTPSCTIISNEVNQAITVTLTGFFCSGRVQFYVAALCELFNSTVNIITDGIFNCTPVRRVSAETNLMFTCDNVNRNLDCKKVNNTPSTNPPDQTTASSTVTPGNQERIIHNPIGIVLPVIICIIVIILVITFVVVYKKRPDLFRGKTQTDASYAVVEKGDHVPL